MYPDPGTGATTVDGYIGQFTGAGADWSTIRNQATGNDARVNVSPDISARTRCDTNTDKWDAFYRNILTFDTSALTSGASISSATFSLWPTTINDGLSPAGSVALVSSNPASDNNIVSGDYDSFGTTSFATALALAAMSTGAYEVWTLNASGLAAISKTGITKFGTRTEADRSDTEPTWNSASQQMLIASMSDEAGTTQDPKLVITYTLGGTPINDTETVGLAEASSLTVDLTDSDTIGVADAESLDTGATPVNDPDTTSVADAESLAVAQAQSDVAGIADAEALVVAQIEADAIALAESSIVNVFITDSDAIGAGDGEALAATQLSAETISMVDAENLPVVDIESGEIILIVDDSTLARPVTDSDNITLVDASLLDTGAVRVIGQIFAEELPISHYLVEALAIETYLVEELPTTHYEIEVLSPQGDLP